uniref:Uncharacterized protein n=1 Tax=Anopheles farauti TaxID=69004 RepID=A0A182QF30_9DIPT
MVGVRSVVFAVFLLAFASARPQFPFFNPLQTGIGLQNPVAGFNLSPASGLTINFGPQPVQSIPGAGVPVPVPSSQPVPVQPLHENNPAASEGLGSRIDDREPDQAPLDEDPCLNLDSSTAVPGAAGDGASAITEQPCLGIGQGNKINPKQAALLSLVG